mgnify:CR=1 FL=1
MGTTYTVKIFEPPSFDSEIQFEVDAVLRRVNDQMSTYLKTSEVSRFNQSESTDWFDVSAETATVVAFAQEVSRATQGAVDVTVGPLVNASTRDKVEQLVDDAVGLGAKVLTGGKRLDRPGYFYEPTVMVNIPDEAEILHTEIFGPVATIVPFDTIDEVVEMANGTIFGLAAYVCGRDVGRALAVAERVEAGVMGINRGFISDPAAPFGGFKQSGIGREGSQEGLHEFLETKYIAVDW